MRLGVFAGLFLKFEIVSLLPLTIQIFSEFDYCVLHSRLFENDKIVGLNFAQGYCLWLLFTQDGFEIRRLAVYSSPMA
jgi:hypothetical protein